MKLFLKKPKPRSDKEESFTIGASIARPSDPQFKAMGFERPLRRLMKEMVKKYPGSIGIEVSGIEFIFILDPDRKKEGRS